MVFIPWYLILKNTKLKQTFFLDFSIGFEIRMQVDIISNKLEKI